MRTLLLASVTLAACRGGEAGGGESGAADAVERWAVEPRPHVVAGAGEGEGALFRVTSATRLTDGRIAVANAGTQQLKVFGARGEHLASIGRRGRGPGEFQFPLWVGTFADSILVWDAALERLSVFDAAGAFQRSVQFPSTGGVFPSVLGLMADGTLVLASGVDQAAATREKAAWRGKTLLLRVSTVGGVLDTLGMIPSSERYSYQSGDGMGLVAEDLPFGRRTITAVSGAQVFVGTGEFYRVHTLRPGEGQREVLRSPWTPGQVSDADVQDYWRNMVTLGGRDDPAEAEKQRREIPYPETLPPYEEMLADQAGRLWIKDAALPRDWNGPQTWRIYSPSGQPIARIELPSRVRPQAIGPDWILGIALGSEHRESVRVYRYRSGSPGL